MLGFGIGVGRKLSRGELSTLQVRLNYKHVHRGPNTTIVPKSLMFINPLFSGSTLFVLILGSLCV